jgi:hypothetical protein
MGEEIFRYTPLKVLDLSACGGIRVDTLQPNSLVELSLPSEGFAAVAKAFLPGSRIEVVRADIGEAEITALFSHLGKWGLKRLRVVSSRVGEYEWRRAEQCVLVELTDPVAVTTPTSLTMTAWREIPREWKPFLRVIDLSGLALELLPGNVTLTGLVWLEGVVLPTGRRQLPEYFFSGCWRLWSIDAGRTALQDVGSLACGGCRRRSAFTFPPTVRSVQYAAFGGTSITTLDLSGTVAEKVRVNGMVSLVDLVLPRRCVLKGVEGVPSLRCVTFGASRHASHFAWHPREVRFESLVADAEFSPGLLAAWVYGEVACELGRETLPFPPP